MARDDFSEETKRKLGERVNLMCSNPACRAPTKGPHANPEKATSVGKACHVHAAAKGGPRYNPSQSEDERSSISNGIWLCSNCATLIDADPDRYPAELLTEWSLEAQLEAHRALGKAKPSTPGEPKPVDRLKAIPVGTEVKLSYVPLGHRDYTWDKFIIRVVAVNGEDNAFQFVSVSGPAHGQTDAIPLGDVQEVWKRGDTWYVRVRGYMDFEALRGHWYRSRA